MSEAMPERIEAFDRGHLEECARLLVASFNAEPWNDSWTLDTARQELEWTMGVPGFVGFVCLHEAAVGLASGWREPDDRREVFFIKTFCVRPDAQGTGVGGRLLGYLNDHLARGGVNTIYLTTREGTPAQRFYEKHGYSVNAGEILMTREW